MRRARGSGREAAVRRGHGRLQAAAPITHTHLCVRTRVYMPMPSLLSPISLCASIAMGRLIARLNNRLRLGSCGAGSLFPSQQPPTALHVTKMLSAGTPLHPHGSWGKSFGWVHPAPACTRAHAAPDPPPPKQSIPCLSAGSRGPAHRCIPSPYPPCPQPLPPRISPWLLYPALHTKELRDRGTAAAMVPFSSSGGIQEGKKKAQQKQTHRHEGSEG